MIRVVLAFIKTPRTGEIRPSRLLNPSLSLFDHYSLTYGGKVGCSFITGLVCNACYRSGPDPGVGPTCGLGPTCGFVRRVGGKLVLEDGAFLLST